MSPCVWIPGVMIPGSADPTSSTGNLCHSDLTGVVPCAIEGRSHQANTQHQCTWNVANWKDTYQHSNCAQTKLQLATMYKLLLPRPVIQY